MCSPGDSTFGLSNVYWLPWDWRRAVDRAVREGITSGIKHRVYRQVFAGGDWGWKIERYNS